MSQPRVLSSDIPAAGRCLGSCREQIKLHDLNKGNGQYKKKRNIYNIIQYEYKGKQPRFIARFETGH